MNIPVLLEPTPTGFRASTGAPLNLVAEAATEEQVLEMIRAQYAVKQLDGIRVVWLDLPLPDPLAEAARRVPPGSPILDQVEAAMKEYRRQRELQDDAAEALAEQERKKAATQDQRKRDSMPGMLTDEARNKTSSAQEPAA